MVLRTCRLGLIVQNAADLPARTCISTECVCRFPFSGVFVLSTIPTTYQYSLCFWLLLLVVMVMVVGSGCKIPAMEQDREMRMQARAVQGLGRGGGSSDVQSSST